MIFFRQEQYIVLFIYTLTIIAKLRETVINAVKLEYVRKQKKWMTKYNSSFHPQEKEYDCGL